MSTQLSMQATIGATEARNNFSELLKRVYSGNEHLVVEKGGIPVAALIGMREYEAFLRWRAQEELQALGQKMADRAARTRTSETELADSLEEDRQKVYRELFGN